LKANTPMALHRDIYWVGRQWAVTGFGVQACNQKQKGQFDIEGARLWEDGVLERLRTESWLNIEDFERALEVARKYYPEPPRKAPRPRAQKVAGPKEPGLNKTAIKETPKREKAVETPKPAAPKFAMRIEGWPAKFVRPWRIRIRG
jgi:hypothetical protein